MSYEDDLDVFFDDEEHAVAATYDSSTAVTVIFDQPFLELQDVAMTNPMAIGKASDFPLAAVGKSLAIDGTTYTIRVREPMDDGALVRLQLQKAS